MCTSIALSPRLSYYGRNLDLEYSFGEEVVVTPRRFPLRLRESPLLDSHYAMMGMAADAQGFPLYAEAINEKGLYMAGLNFPGNAFYDGNGPQNGQPVAPYELIPLVLGSCASLEEARALLARIRLVALPFGPEYPLAPLHWHIADPTGSLVLEPLAEGLRLYNDPAGVLTNNPPFPFQLMNLNNYQQLTALPPENRFSGDLPLAPYGQGMGAMGLPGDCSPMSRFVRAAFLRAKAVCGSGEEEAVGCLFHILDAVAMVRGSVITPEGKEDMTRYSCCASAESRTYYYKTYGNSQITAVRLLHQDLESTRLTVFPLLSGPQFRFQG